MPALVLIDGSGLTFRSFYGLPPLSTPEGTPVGAVVGFCNALLKLYEDHQPSHWAVAFDLKAPTFRHTLFPAYKQNRLAPPVELVPQFALIRQVCKLLNIIGIDQEGVEADDLIASYSCEAQRQGWDVLIVSADKDMAQLVTPHVTLYDPFKQKTLDAQSIQDLWGVPPALTPDVQALAGDTSDNIPGIPGVGPKTATQWIQHFGSLDALLSRLHEIAPAKKQELVRQHVDQARLYHQLVRLKKDLPLAHALSDFIYRPPHSPQLVDFLDQHHMGSLKARLTRKGLITPSATASPPQAIPLTFQGIFQEIIEQGYVALAPHWDEKGVLLGAGASWRPHQGIYLTPDDVQALLLNPHCLKIVHDSKTLIHTLARSPSASLPAKLCPFDDIMLLSYIAEGGHVKHDFPSLAERLFSQEAPPPASLEEWGQRAHLYFQCWLALKKKIREIRGSTIYSLIDLPLVEVLAKMESRGIEVDIDYLAHLTHQFSEEIQSLEARIYALAGRPFTIGSPKQLGQILFQDLGWPESKKGKSGAFQTSSDVLEGFASQGKELAQLVLEWRQLTKLQTTYTEPLAHQADPLTRRVHTTYSMVTTSTGRLSSLNPNLQNIPIRTPEGRKIRQAFRAPPGYVLLSLDYSQIELRLLAHMGKEERLQQAFHAHKDIHQQTACELFQRPPDQITPEMRRQAKIINFGLIYGMSAFGLSQQMGVSSQEATRIINVYFSRYPGIAQYIELCKEKGRQQGYVTTLWGRRCFLPHIQSRHYGLRSAAERQAINAPLQGTSADLIKRAMISIDDWIESSPLPVHMLLQVHDELILEVPQDKVEEVAQALIPLMTSAASLSVPLEVNASWGPSWKA